MTTPALSDLRRDFPEARIDLLVVPWVRDIFSRHPAVDQIVVYDRDGRHGGLRGKMRLAAELKAHEYDAAVLFQNAFEAALIAFLADIPIRAGYRTDLRGPLLTHAVTRTARDRRIHQTDYYLTLLRRLGLPITSPELHIEVEASAKSEVSRMRTEIFDDRPIVVTVPGAKYGSAKMWPVENYARLVKALREEWLAGVVLLGSASEKEICDAIRKEADDLVLDMSGRCSLSEAVAWIDAANLVISNDAGMMHVAAALKKPQIALFGPTKQDVTSPLNAGAGVINLHVPCAPCMKKTCPRDHSCMTGIDPRMVLEEAGKLWKPGKLV